MTTWGKYGPAEPDGGPGGDLAQQAAEWVPPWARQPQPELSETPASPEHPDSPGRLEAVADDDPGLDGEADTDSEAAAETDVEAVAEDHTDVNSDVEADVEPGVDTQVATDVAQVPHPRQADRPEPAASGGFADATEQAHHPDIPARLASALATDPPGLNEADLIPTLEAIMLVVDEPVSEITLSQVLDVPAELIAGTLIDLSASYTRQGRGFDLRRAAGGWRLYTRSEYAPYVERFVLDGQQLRLTQASLETLAVVAYKQPVTRSRISAIRGVNCDGVIRTLISRGMVEECGTDPESGAHLYRTTTLFLEKLGLDSVDELPSLAPFLPDDIEEIADEQR